MLHRYGIGDVHRRVDGRQRLAGAHPVQQAEHGRRVLRGVNAELLQRRQPEPDAYLVLHRLARALLAGAQQAEGRIIGMPPVVEAARDDDADQIIGPPSENLRRDAELQGLRSYLNCTLASRCPIGYPTRMKKTSVYLDEADLARIQRLAELHGTSQAEVIRAAIHAYERSRPERHSRSWAASKATDRPWPTFLRRNAEGVRRLTLIVDAGPMVAGGDARDPGKERWRGS